RGPGEHGGSSWSRWPGCRASGFGSVRAPRRGEGCRPDVTPALPSGEAAYEMDLQLGRVHSASFGSLRLLSNQCARPLEDLVEHRRGEPPGGGVLLARMVGAEKNVRTRRGLCPVGESWPRPNLVATHGDGPKCFVPCV